MLSCRNWRPVGKRDSQYHGVVLVRKPAGPSSFHVVRTIGRKFGTRRCGHTGTLDPFASGLMCICVGEATKVASFLVEDSKEYRAVLRLGQQTATGDTEGEVVHTAAVPEDIEMRLHQNRFEFQGEITQVPPIYSAIKVDGRRLYDYARKGDSVDIPARRVLIHELEIEACHEERVVFRVRCGKGTYIRTLGEDLAKACGTVGHLESLERTALGHWTLEDALDLDSEAEVFREALMASREALQGIPQIPVDESTARKIGFGQAFELGEATEEVANRGIGLALTESGQGLALVRMVDDRPKVQRGFAHHW